MSLDKGASSSGTVGTAASTLAVDVVWGDLTKVKGDVLAVGHYIGVLPQNAELELDRQLSNLPDAKEGDRRLFITDQTARGAIRGALGETVLLPWPPDRHVALAGMGRPGAFREPELRVLAYSLVSTKVRLLASLRRARQVSWIPPIGSLPHGMSRR